MLSRYAAEGLASWQSVAFADNAATLALLDARHTGLLDVRHMI